jgi:hypothetical protein
MLAVVSFAGFIVTSSSMDQNIRDFADAFRQSIVDGTFVKLTLGHYMGSGKGLQKMRVRRIETAKGTRFSAVYQFERKDVTKNFNIDEIAALAESELGLNFRSGHLFTTAGYVEFRSSKKGNSHIVRSRRTSQLLPSRAHDREKRQFIEPAAQYLHPLGITTVDGKVRDRQQGKWRQINKFVEILDGLYGRSNLAGRPALRVVDMGSGKGYLTFAVYDHFRRGGGLAVSVVGVEARRELVQTCNAVASANGFSGLTFVQGTIADFDLPGTDILIALHACDTATDDALFKGIRAGAEVVVAAPCCHQELRPQLKSPPQLSGLLKHGVMAENMAEMVTDSLRALLLEQNGYDAKVFDFVPFEHTPKNKLIVGVRRNMAGGNVKARHDYAELKKAFGIVRQRLEELLA